MDSARALVPRRTAAIVGLLWWSTAIRSASAIQPHSSDWATQVGNKWPTVVYESLQTMSFQGFFFDWNSPSAVLPTPITGTRIHSVTLRPSLTIDLNSSM